MMNPELNEPVYAVVAVISGPDPDAGPRMEWIEAWPRTSDGAIMATRRAMRLSVTGGPHEVHRPDGRMLARFVEGRRADLPPGGIIRLADAKAAAQIIDKVARHL